MGQNKYIILYLCSFIFSILCGCSYKAEYANTNYSTLKSTNIIETDDYYIFKTNEYYVHDKSSNEEYPLIDNPLESKEMVESVSKIKTNGNTVYYMYDNIDSQSTIESLNLDTGDRKTLYIDYTYGKHLSLFNIEINKQSAMQYDNSGYELIDFLIFKTNIILIRREIISKIHNNNEKILYEGYFNNLANNKENIFFTNESGNLCSINIVTEKIEENSLIKCSRFFIDKDYIFYISPSKNYSFVIFDKKSEKILYEYTGEWKDMAFNNGKLVLINKNNELYFINNKLCLNKLEINCEFDEFILAENGNELILFKYDIKDFNQFTFIDLKI